MITRQLVEKSISIFEDKLKKFVELYECKTLEEFTSNTTGSQKTQEKTKALSPLFDKSFQLACVDLGFDINGVNERGYDIIFNQDGESIKYEMKMTFSTSNSWTGNCYSQVKENNYILIKLDVDDNLKVSKLFFATLKSEHSEWKGNKIGNTAFSSLSIDVNDIENLNIIYGSVRPAKKYLIIEKEALTT